eukprot:3157188-Rhodomonas_salina.1
MGASSSAAANHRRWPPRSGHAQRRGGPSSSWSCAAARQRATVPCSVSHASWMKKGTASRMTIKAKSRRAAAST